MNKKELNIFVAIVFIVIAGYAIIRYNLAKELPFSQLPIYVLNKAFAYFALFSFGMLIIPKKIFFYILENKTQDKIQFFVSLGVFSVTIHLVMSLIILNNNYFPQLISDNNQLTTNGAWSLFFSTIAIAIVVLTNRVSKNNNTLIFIFLISIIFHLIFLGYGSWLNVYDWPWYLPPISLLAFIDGMFLFFCFLSNRQ